MRQGRDLCTGAVRIGDVLFVRPEGCGIHFPGEHTSLKHTWIEGTIESGVRTALAVSEGSKPAIAQLGKTRCQPHNAIELGTLSQGGCRQLDRRFSYRVQ